MLLLVEPAARARTVLIPRLERGCGAVIEVGSAELALQACADCAVDLVVVNARFPAWGAEGLCRALVERDGPPVLGYCVGVSPQAHIRWFDAGGADCLSGDDPVLLAARCRAILRRRGAELPPRTPSTG